MTQVHGVGPGTRPRWPLCRDAAHLRGRRTTSAGAPTTTPSSARSCSSASPRLASVAAAALDAARRAAGIEDPRLVRVLDVGTDQGVGFIVEEPLTGAVPLSHLLQRGGLAGRRGAPPHGRGRDAPSTRRATAACTTSP